ncbi:MAG: hypothetical protein QOH68_319 [Nocardioidaceae bacterium]|nr:hypothetical protein [Nocardioidaceae bacterium]
MVNTWGAKGVFVWDDPRHFGTAGLQARDFELAGLGAVDRLITSGLDPAEVTSAPWTGRAEVLDVSPSDLADLAEEWSEPRRTPTRPPLYTELAAAIGPMYDDPDSPPGRIRAMSEGLAPNGVVLAPPGLVGYWVARAWPTTVAGSVIVPSTTEPGLVERLAAEAVSAGRPTMLVTDRQTAIDGVEVILWDDDLAIPTTLLEVAGPLVAWT